MTILPAPPANWKRPAIPKGAIASDINHFQDVKGRAVQPYYAAYLLLNGYTCIEEAKTQTGSNADYMCWIGRMWRKFEKERGIKIDGWRSRHEGEFVLWLQSGVDDAANPKPQVSDWPGPLFYPPVGKIAVMGTGARIEIWDDESESADCFTGFKLLEGRSEQQRVVFDLSCMWDRSQIERIEDPTPDDLRLGMLPREVAA